MLAAKRSSFPGFRNNLGSRKGAWEHLALHEKPDQKHRYEILKLESFLPKFTLRTIMLLALLLFGGVNGAHAQRVSAYFGLGSAKDRAGTTSNSTNACQTGQLFDGLICEPGPTIGGLFGVFGVDVRFKRHLGINAEYTFHFKQVPFLPDDSLNMRPAFYDVNVMWMRVAGKRIAPAFGRRCRRRQARPAFHVDNADYRHYEHIQLPGRVETQSRAVAFWSRTEVLCQREHIHQAAVRSTLRI